MKKNDIFSSQQHLKTLTKTDKNSVRILTNYTIIKMAIENLKFNVSDIFDILKYIQQRYPNLLLSANEKEATFEDGDKIFLTGETVLESLNRNIYIDQETNVLKDKNNPDAELKTGRFEFLYDFILSKIQNVNPKDNLTKTKKSIPYVSLYMSGVKLPFILYLWSQKGLLSTLNYYGIDYIITKDRGELGEIVVELANDEFLVLKPNSIKERLLINGLLVNKLKYPISNLDDPKEILQHISDTYGKLVPWLNK